MIAYCATCDEQIDTKLEPFHFDECGREDETE